MCFAQLLGCSHWGRAQQQGSPAVIVWNSKGAHTNKLELTSCNWHCGSAMAAATTTVMEQRKPNILWESWVLWRMGQAAWHVPKRHLESKSLVGRSSVRALRLFLCFVFNTGAYSLQTVVLSWCRFLHICTLPSGMTWVCLHCWKELDSRGNLFKKHIAV